MDYISIIGIGIGLSMDAFAAALSCGAADSKVSLNKTLKISLSFGIFQALMPFIGWIAGKVCADFIGAIDHYIAFILLGWIGGKMIYDSLIKKEDDENSSADLSLKSLMLLAVATSIDALVTGIILPSATGASTFGLMIVAISIIGLITFTLSFTAVYLGKAFGTLLKNKAETFGGAVLIIIGLKILIEHLFFQ